MTASSPAAGGGSLGSSVSLAEMDNLAQDTIIGRATASTGVPEAITCTSAGRALIDDVSATQMRQTLGVVIGTHVQAFDNELSALAQVVSAADRVPYFDGSNSATLATLTAAGRALIDDADASAQRTTLGLAIGTNVQAYDAELAAIAGLTSAADKVPYFTGSGTAGVADFTAAGRALIDDADAAAQRVTLGLNTRTLIVVVFPPLNNVTTGDGAFYITIPPELNGWNLTLPHGRVITAGTTGTMDVQIHNVTDSVDMLSTKLTWDSTEAGTDTAATPCVVNTTYDDVATNDVLRIDVDAVQTTPAKGMIIRLPFQQA